MNRMTFKQIIMEKTATYRLASVKEKTKIISSITAVSGKNRKSVIRALNRQSVEKSRCTVKFGRPRKYTSETEAALAYIWEQYNYPSAERLFPIMSEAISIFRRDDMWSYSELATSQLKQMSLGSIKVRTVNFSKNH